jgi:hypothetical protein
MNRCGLVIVVPLANLTVTKLVELAAPAGTTALKAVEVPPPALGESTPLKRTSETVVKELP